MGEVGRGREEQEAGSLREGPRQGCSKAVTLFAFSAPQLTAILRPLRPFGQVVVEKFQ